VGGGIDGAVALQGLADGLVDARGALDRVVVDKGDARDAAHPQDAADLAAHEAGGIRQHVADAALVAVGAVDRVEDVGHGEIVRELDLGDGQEGRARSWISNSRQ
jgi:hypothetical protein